MGYSSANIRICVNGYAALAVERKRSAMRAGRHWGNSQEAGVEAGLALEVRRELVARDAAALGEDVAEVGEVVEEFGMVMARRFRALRRWLEGRGAGGGTSTRRGAAATAPKVRGQASGEDPPRGARRGFRARRAYLRG